MYQHGTRKADFNWDLSSRGGCAITLPRSPLSPLNPSRPSRPGIPLWPGSPGIPGYPQTHQFFLNSSCAMHLTASRRSKRVTLSLTPIMGPQGPMLQRLPIEYSRSPFSGFVMTSLDCAGSTVSITIGMLARQQNGGVPYCFPVAMHAGFQFWPVVITSAQ